MIKIGKKFITITPIPAKTIIGGLKVYLNKPVNEYSLPIAVTNIIKNKQRYYYKDLGRGIVVIKVELLNEKHELQNKTNK